MSDKKIWMPKTIYILKKYNCMFENLLKEYDITQIEVDILAFLANNPQYNHAQDIVDLRGISKAHVSLAIEKLVKKGWLTRKPDQSNRRCNILILTDRSHDIVLKIQNIQKQYNQITFQGLSENDIRIFQDIINQMFENLGGKQKGEQK